MAATYAYATCSDRFNRMVTTMFTMPGGEKGGVTSASLTHGRCSLPMNHAFSME
jgi:hypothetical protein